MSKSITITTSIVRPVVPWYVSGNGQLCLDDEAFFDDFEIEVEGFDYEPADPSVGIMTGGFTDFTAYFTATNCEAILTEEEAASVLERLNEAAADDASDLEGWQ